MNCSFKKCFCGEHVVLKYMGGKISDIDIQICRVYRTLKSNTKDSDGMLGLIHMHGICPNYRFAYWGENLRKQAVARVNGKNKSGKWTWLDHKGEIF